VEDDPIGVEPAARGGTARQLTPGQRATVCEVPDTGLAIDQQIE